MTELHLTWTTGGEARVLSLDAERVTLDSTVPFPPGARVDGAVAGATATLRVKVHGSRAGGDGRFRIEGRPIDLTRDTREAIARLTSGDG